MSVVPYQERLQVLNTFLAKSDGKDKLTALIQYALMFLSANEPGQIKTIQANVTIARKVFRVMRPLEVMIPVINNPKVYGTANPMPVEVINKLKAILMAVYFGADHFAWAAHVGLIKDKQTGERLGKLSLWSWALGSVCQVVSEAWQLRIVQAQAPPARKEGESDADYGRRVTTWSEQRAEALFMRKFMAAHGVAQMLLAAGLLQVAPFKPRTVGVIGVIASAMNCYALFPPLPKTAAAAAAAPAKTKAA